MPASVARRLQPEMLDILPAGDPRAARCRRDLKFINWLIGNHRWIRRMLAKHAERIDEGIFELGAGDGDFLVRLRRAHPGVRLTGFDLASRPATMAGNIGWHAGDLFEHDGPWPGTALIANLFLHHFTFEQISLLGRRLDGVRLLVIGEAHRTPEALRRSCLLNPFLGEVTRHDMEISMAAGFVKGELPDALGLSTHEWTITEDSTFLGALRLLAVRK